MIMCEFMCFFFFQAEDGIRDLVRSRGLGDVYKRQIVISSELPEILGICDRIYVMRDGKIVGEMPASEAVSYTHLTLPTSDLV